MNASHLKEKVAAEEAQDALSATRRGGGVVHDPGAERERLHHKGLHEQCVVAHGLARPARLVLAAVEGVVHHDEHVAHQLQIVHLVDAHLHLIQIGEMQLKFK